MYINIKWQGNTVYLEMVRVRYVDYMDFVFRDTRDVIVSSFRVKLKIKAIGSERV